MSTFYFESFSFDDERGTLKGPDGDTYLRPKTAQLLQYFLKNPGKLIKKQTLFTYLWPDSVVTEHTLSQSIKELRQVLGDDAKAPHFIKTLPKKGFQWLVPIENPEGLNRPKAPPESQLKYRVFSQLFALIVHRRMRILMVTLVLITISIIWSSHQHHSDNEQPLSLSKPMGTTKIAILPIINATEDPQMDWVQLGLWDMLLNALKQYKSIDLISHGTIQNQIQENVKNSQLTFEQLDTLNDEFNATLTIQLKLEHDHTGYRLVYIWADRRSPNQMFEGLYSYDNSVGKVDSVVNNLVESLAIANSGKTSVLPVSNIGAANQDMARGIQAFQTDSIRLARHYFEAALIRDPAFLRAQQFLAKTEFLTGNWPRSQALYDQLLNTTLANSARAGLAKMAIAEGNFQYAQTLLDEALRSAKTIDDKPAQVEALWGLAELKVMQGLWQEQQQLLNKAKLLSKEIDDIGLRYRAFYLLGRLDSPGENKASRTMDLQSALAYFRRWDNVRGEAATLLALGTKEELPHDQRIEFQLSALGKYQKIGDRVGEAWAAMSIGWTYLQQFDPHSADSYLKLAITIHNDMKAYSNVALDKFYLGFSALDKGAYRNGSSDLKQLRLARKYLLESISMFTTIGMPERIPVGHLLLATISIDEQKYANAQERIPFIVATSMPSQVRQMQAMGQIVRAFIEIRRKNWQKAINILVPLQAQIGDNAIVLRYLADCFYHLGEYQKAIELSQALKKRITKKWSDSDQQRLQYYRNALSNQQSQTLPAVPNPYLLMISYIF